ncbi:hypothetical protein [Paractinoplanes globisporus]|uniref:Uncharacterized protein n=1 Tax=Paractinoplanes globisporus TaxID=113565 RepID=A0ABW6WK36_9ACTN|nr:hypothetical protein [Actinoplanes globisporus]
MSSPIYLPDDRAFFSFLEMTPSNQHVALCETMGVLVVDRTLRFPPEVCDDVKRKADLEADARLCIWMDAIRASMDCTISWGAKRKAQGWAQANGYPEGLDPVVDGRQGTCIVAVVGYVMELTASGLTCTVITNDFRSRPGRAPLGEVCGKLGVDTVTPMDFVKAVIKPLMA